MISVNVRRWAAWAPGLEDEKAWRGWSEDPGELGSEGRPEARFLPPMLRRRCGSLARIMLTTAFDCCDPDEISDVNTVFASRHGNINESIDLLDRLAFEKPLSPTKFSHTVHNAQAGLFSIASENRLASSSVAAHEDSFACGYLEALTLLERDPERSVLLVVGDVPLAPVFAALVDEPVGSYGLALLLEVREGGTPDSLDFGMRGASLSMSTSMSTSMPTPARVGTSPGFSAVPTTNSGAASPAASEPPTTHRAPAWPDAIEFLRWYLSDDSELVLGRGQRRWRWLRRGIGEPARLSTGPSQSLTTPTV